MTHLPYIIASYSIFLAAVLWLSIGVTFRLSQATKRLAAIDQRPRGSAQ